MQRPQSCGRAIGRNRESFVARQDQNATHGRRAIRAPRKTRARQLETKINIVSQSAVMKEVEYTGCRRHAARERQLVTGRCGSHIVYGRPSARQVVGRFLHLYCSLG